MFVEYLIETGSVGSYNVTALNAILLQFGEGWVLQTSGDRTETQGVEGVAGNLQNVLAQAVGSWGGALRERDELI
jgi:hypothetical protein